MFLGAKARNNVYSVQRFKGGKESFCINESVVKSYSKTYSKHTNKRKTFKCRQQQQQQQPQQQQQQNQQKDLQQQQQEQQEQSKGPFQDQQYGQQIMDQKDQQQQGGQTFKLRNTDLVLHGHTGQEVLVFGVNHYQPVPQIGDILLQTKCKALVCETSITPKHGLNLGAEFDPEKHWDTDYDLFLKDIMSYSVLINNDGGFNSKVWQQMRTQAPGEMAAYVAAISKQVPVIFGDRPKPSTYKRLIGKVTEQDLDKAYNKRVQQNYVDQLLLQGVDVRHLFNLQDLISDDVVDEILLNERDAIMCFIVDQQVRRTSYPTVVMIGQDHLPKFERYWKTGEWKQIYRRALQDPPPDLFKREAQSGFKRGLLYALLNLIAPPQTLYDINETLDDLKVGEEQEIYNQVFSLYCNPRMFLSCCSQGLLEHIYSPVKQSDKPDKIYKLLEPYRKQRITNGGQGFTSELVEDVIDSEKAFHRWYNSFDKAQ